MALAQRKDNLVLFGYAVLARGHHPRFGPGCRGQNGEVSAFDVLLRTALLYGGQFFLGVCSFGSGIFTFAFWWVGLLRINKNR